MSEAVATTGAGGRVANLGRSGAIADILIYLAAALGFWGIEEALRAADMFPYPGLFDGGFSQIASFFVVVGLMKWRGQTWSDFGLKRTHRWWFIPFWGFVILVVNVVAQLTLLPALAYVLKVGPPDFSRYDILRGNFVDILGECNAWAILDDAPIVQPNLVYRAVHDIRWIV